MAVTSIKLPGGNMTSTQADKVFDFDYMLGEFSCGKVLIANGGYTQAEAETAFATKQSLQSELNKFIEIGDAAESPGKSESKVDKLKTAKRTIDGKRTNTIELNVAGMNQERKQWFEEDLNKEDRTVVIVNTQETAILVFNKRRWSCDWSYEIGNLFNAVMTTEYIGPTRDSFLLFINIPDSAN